MPSPSFDGIKPNSTTGSTGNSTVISLHKKNSSDNFNSQSQSSKTILSHQNSPKTLLTASAQNKNKLPLINPIFTPKSTLIQPMRQVSNQDFVNNSPQKTLIESNPFFENSKFNNASIDFLNKTNPKLEISLAKIKTEIQTHNKKNYFKNLIQTKIINGQKELEIFDLDENYLGNEYFETVQSPKSKNANKISPKNSFDITNLDDVDYLKNVSLEEYEASFELANKEKDPIDGFEVELIDNLDYSTLVKNNDIEPINFVLVPRIEDISAFESKYQKYLISSIKQNYRTVISAIFTIAVVSFSMSGVMSINRSQADYNNSKADAVSVDPNSSIAQKEKYKNCLLSEGILTYLQPNEDADSDGLTNLEECRIGSKILNAKSCGDKTDLQSLTAMIDPSNCSKLEVNKLNLNKFQDIVNVRLLQNVVETKKNNLKP